MNGNPTLKVISYSKSQSLDMVMESIRETGTLVNKSSKIVRKDSKERLNKDKFNLLMKKYVTDMKKKMDKNLSIKKDPLDEIKFDKQINEIEILVDIIKKTGDVPKIQNHTPMVHVPLPKEFYELKPLVSFRGLSKRTHKRASSARQKVLKENVNEHMPLDIGYDHYQNVPKTLQKQVVVRNTLETKQDKKYSIKQKEKHTVDKETLTKPRTKLTADKATLTTQRSVPNDQSDNLIVKKRSNVTEELVFALERELRKVQKAQNLLKAEVHKVEKVDKDENEPHDFPALREMSTIASFSPGENRLSSQNSLEIVSDNKGFHHVVDANDLYVVNNGWTVVEPTKDPFENALVVKLKTSSSQKPSSDRAKYKSKSDDTFDAYVHYTDESPNQTSTTKENVHGEITNPVDDKLQKDKHKSHLLENKDSVQEDSFIEPPELDLTPAHKYNQKLSQVLGLNTNWNNIDYELQEEVNNMEAELYKQTDSQDRTSASVESEKSDESDSFEYFKKSGKENVKVKLKKEVEIVEVEKDKKLDEQVAKQQQKEKDENENKRETKEPSDEIKQVSKSQKELKPKHRRSKSQKRSKKKVPEVHLSDYKGFYVVHTTNDWSFS